MAPTFIKNYSRTLRVFNHGNRAAVGFRVVIGVPEAVTASSDGLWPEVGRFPIRSGRLRGYTFYGHNSELVVYPQDYIDFGMVSLHGDNDEALANDNKPMVWRIYTQNDRQPSPRRQYFVMTTNYARRASEARRWSIDDDEEREGMD
jgi:hypothetical protein